MRPLKDVIVALRHELEEALQANQDLPYKNQLEADRIILTMELAVSEETGTSGQAGLSFGVVVADVNASAEANRKRERTKTHTLTIEFKPRVVQPTPPGSSKPFAQRIKEAEPGEPVDREPHAHRVELLSMIFGAPGSFDAYCRADIFKTAVVELTDAGYSLLLAAIGGRKIPKRETDVALAYGQIGNILKTGAAKSAEKGAAILQESLTGISRNELKLLIESTWRNEPMTTTTSPKEVVEIQPLKEATKAPIHEASGEG
jgi:hypothetical protein